MSTDDTAAIDPEDNGLDQCALINCRRPPKGGTRGELCEGHDRQMQAKYAGIVEPELERKLAAVRTPPPSVDYEPDPDYVAPVEWTVHSSEQPQAGGSDRPRSPTAPRLRQPDWLKTAGEIARTATPVGADEPEDALVYLSDALEGRLGAIKAAQAQVLVQLTANALRAL